MSVVAYLARSGRRLFRSVEAIFGTPADGSRAVRVPTLTRGSEIVTGHADGLRGTQPGAGEPADCWVHS